MYIRALYGGSLDRNRISGLGRYPDRLRQSIFDSKGIKTVLSKQYVDILSRFWASGVSY